MKISLLYILLTSLLTVSLFSLCSQEISFMTYNIRYDNPNDKEDAWQNRKADLVSLLNTYHPDFAGTQEGLLHQLEFIKENAGDYSYIGVARDDGAQAGEFTALFYNHTQFDLLSEETFWLSETPEQVSRAWDAALPRICTYGIFRMRNSDIKIHVYNTHFDHVGKIARKQSAALIIDHMRKSTTKDDFVILMGDFNCESSDDPITLIKTYLDDGLEQINGQLNGPPGTFNGFDTKHIPERRIDYIFSKNFNFIKYSHIDDKTAKGRWVSDHLPVLANLKI